MSGDPGKIYAVWLRGRLFKKIVTSLQMVLIIGSDVLTVLLWVYLNSRQYNLLRADLEAVRDDMHAGFEAIDRALRGIDARFNQRR